ncbi:Hypothetical predicted protein [Podarcis lilfordi]|uniref:Uncharacterized protein n=1 Tax=Podarcis lilfordi TaxID=74358 RepID=A0AA35QPV2_9SAUR|nr:Hypothetical predicted protein [Podarcis lilfordi]
MEPGEAPGAQGAASAGPPAVSAAAAPAGRVSASAALPAAEPPALLPPRGSIQAGRGVRRAQRRSPAQRPRPGSAAETARAAAAVAAAAAGEATRSLQQHQPRSVVETVCPPSAAQLAPPPPRLPARAAAAPDLSGHWPEPGNSGNKEPPPTSRPGQGRGGALWPGSDLAPYGFILGGRRRVRKRRAKKNRSCTCGQPSGIIGPSGLPLLTGSPDILSRSLTRQLFKPRCGRICLGAFHNPVDPWPAIRAKQLIIPQRSRSEALPPQISVWGAGRLAPPHRNSAGPGQGVP